VVGRHSTQFRNKSAVRWRTSDMFDADLSRKWRAAQPVPGWAW
jgi:hypothetical protein